MLWPEGLLCAAPVLITADSTRPSSRHSARGSRRCCSSRQRMAATLSIAGDTLLSLKRLMMLDAHASQSYQVTSERTGGRSVVRKAQSIWHDRLMLMHDRHTRAPHANVSARAVTAWPPVTRHCTTGALAISTVIIRPSCVWHGRGASSLCNCTYHQIRSPRCCSSSPTSRTARPP
jgi:hypothetical protein